MTDSMKLKIHEKLKILKFFKTANFKTVGAACCRLFQLSLFLQNQGSNIIILFLSFFYRFNSHVSKWYKVYIRYIYAGKV